MTGPNKPEEPSTRSVKHTVLWRPEEWDRIEAAAKALEADTHTEIDAPNFIRGAVMRRTDEILGPVIDTPQAA